MKKTTKNSLLFSKCDENVLEQKWEKVNIVSAEGSHFCIEKKCLTVVFTTKIIKSKPDIILQSLDKKPYSHHQQWKFKKEAQKIKNFATKLCLVVANVVPQNNSVSSGPTLKFKIDVDTCLEEPNNLQKWSFLRLVPLCYFDDDIE